MSINLTKGQKIDLSKDNNPLSKLMVGLGWDAASKTGLFGMFSSNNIDCDASVIMVNENNKITNNKNIVYFGNLYNPNRSVVHQGDNITGEGDNDDEQIMVDLDKIDTDVNKLIFAVNIYSCASRKQHFGMIQNAYIRIVDTDSNQEICKFNLTNDYSGSTALIVGEIYRNNGKWKFNALGAGTQDTSLTEMCKKYQ